MCSMCVRGSKRSWRIFSENLPPPGSRVRNTFSPRCSNHFLRRRAWVDFPTPSVPSSVKKRFLGFTGAWYQISLSSKNRKVCCLLGANFIIKVTWKNFIVHGFSWDEQLYCIGTHEFFERGHIRFHSFFKPISSRINVARDDDCYVCAHRWCFVDAGYFWIYRQVTSNLQREKPGHKSRSRKNRIPQKSELLPYACDHQHINRFRVGRGQLSV